MKKTRSLAPSSILRLLTARRRSTRIVRSARLPARYLIVMWHKRHALPKRHNKSLTFALPARPPPSCRAQESLRGEGNDSTFLRLPRPAGVRPHLSGGMRASFSGFRALFSPFGFYAYCLWPPFSLSSEAPERWPSGRRRSPAKGVEVKSFSWVRIPSSPPATFEKIHIYHDLPLFA